MYTLTLCIGIFLGVCGQAREFDYQDEAACQRARVQQLQMVGGGYAVCAPKALGKNKS